LSQYDIKEKTSSGNSKKTQSQRILILGSGFAGIEVLKNLQKRFQNDKNIDIILVSRDNFLLFTPMLPEVSSGTIDTRHIVTPVRTFCRQAKFYQAEIKSIDLGNKMVIVEHAIGKQFARTEWHTHTLVYDYLVISLGSKTNFYGMSDLEKSCFTMKSIDDAIIIRNHIIDVLEQASIEQDNDKDLTKELLTFVVVGGGFSGIETIGALNDFIRETVKEFYKNIFTSQIRLILVCAEDRILAEVDDELGEFALQKLKENGVEFIMKTMVNGAAENGVKLDNGTIIQSYTVIWTAGVTPDKLITTLPCDHDNETGRIMSNSYLEVPGHDGVYALGDCAAVINPKTEKPYPPTAQYAIRQAKVAARNIVSTVNAKVRDNNNWNKDKKKKKFDYQAKGIMADIGNRNGVAIIFGLKLQGFIAWWLWRTFYLTNLPTSKKKIKVMSDWIMDLLFRSDISMIKRFAKEEAAKKGELHDLEMSEKKNR
jgi:NADH dehydrogenase